METLPVTIDRERAAELYRAYQVHQHYEKPIDEEIRRTYRLIAQGRVIIQALESIKLAGRNDEGWPKLAIARADQKSQWCTLHSDGSATMQPSAMVPSIVARHLEGRILVAGRRLPATRSRQLASRSDGAADPAAAAAEARPGELSRALGGRVDRQGSLRPDAAAPDRPRRFVARRRRLGSDRRREGRARHPRCRA